LERIAASAWREGACIAEGIVLIDEASGENVVDAALVEEE